MALTKTQVSELYVAIFNRASEGEGNTFWQSGESVAAVATDMLASDAAKEYFGSALDTNQAFIEHIYQNTLNKTAADDAEGIQFWVDALDAGASRGEIIASLVEAAQDPKNAGAAQDQFLNRVAVSDYTADTLASVELNNLDSLTFGAGLTVTAEPSTVESAKAAVDSQASGFTAELTASASQINEGESNTFTLTTSEPVQQDTEVKFSLVVEGESASLEDFNAGAFNSVIVTIPAGETEATFDVESIAADGTEVSETYRVEAVINGETISEQVTLLDGAEGAGQTFQLTEGVDVIPGLEGSNGNTVTSGNDEIIGVVGTNATLQGTDQINAGDGVDTLRVIADAAINNDLPKYSNVEILNIDSSAAITLDTDTQAALEQVKIIGAGGALDLEASDAQQVSVAGAEAAVAVDGGQNVTVSDSVADNAITIGDTTVNNGTVEVTDTKQGNAAIAINGGTDVTVNATADQDTTGGTSGAINVGQGATPAEDLASGAVSVTQNLDSDGTNADLVGGDITVDGGSSIDVAVNATSAAAAKDSDNDIYIGTVNAGAGDTTSSISVTQNSSVTTKSVEASGGVTETASVKFGALKEGDALEVAGLIFTASTDLEAEQVAQAFADLTATDRQDDGGVVANGVYTGVVNGNWTSGEVNGDTVVFTSETENAGVTNLPVTLTNTSTNSVSPTVTTTQGKTNTVAAAESGNAVFNGAVVVDDNATASVETVTLDGYGNAEIGVNNSMDALTTLNLSNSGSSVAAVTGVDAATTTPGDGTTQEVQTLDFSNWVVTTGGDFDIDVGGTKTTVAVAAGDTGSDIATKVAAALDGSDIDGDTKNDSAAANGSVVTITYGVTGDVAQAQAAVTGAGDAVFANAEATTQLQTAQTALELNVDDVNGDVDLDNTGTDANITDLTLNASGEESDFALTAAAVENLTIDAASRLDLRGSTIGTGNSLTSVSVAGSAAVNLGVVQTSTALDSFDASSNTAGVTATIDTDSNDLGEIQEYLFGAGDDSITLNDADVTVDVTLGAGDDTLELLADSTTVPTASVAGGEGVDTISMTVTGADGLDNSTAFSSAISGFERLVLNDAGTTENVDLANLGFADHVTTTGGIVTLQNVNNDATVVLTANGTITAELADAAGSADSLNTVVTADNGLDAGTFVAAGVETINITSTDSNVDEDDDGVEYEAGDRDTNILEVQADSAETVTITGNSDFELDFHADTDQVTLVDASTLEGALDVTADSAAAGTEVRGGAGDDVLRASGEEDVLKGGAGDDTISAGDLTQVYGGDGADTFNFAVNSNLTKVSTIHDFGAGDTINLQDNGTVGAGAAVGKFYAQGAQYNENTTTDVAGKVEAALVQTGEGEASWFNHNGYTYIVIDADDANDVAAGAVDAYQEGEDTVIELVGTFDLSTGASFNADSGTLEFA